MVGSLESHLGERAVSGRCIRARGPTRHPFRAFTLSPAALLLRERRSHLLGNGAHVTRGCLEPAGGGRRATLRASIRPRLAAWWAVLTGTDAGLPEAMGLSHLADRDVNRSSRYDCLQVALAQPPSVSLMPG